MSPIVGTKASNSAQGYGFFTLAPSGGFLGYLADGLAAVNQVDYANGVTVDSSKNLYSAGQFKNSNTRSNASFVKHNSTGTLQFQRAITDPNASASQYAIGYGIAIDTASNLYVCGEAYNSSTGINAFIAKYNSSGTIQWQRYLSDGNSAGNNSDSAFGVGTDSSNNVFVCGKYYNTDLKYNAFIAKYNSSGAIQWQRKLLANAGSDSALAVATDSSGNSYIVGSYINASSQNTAFLIKYDSSGTIQWQRRLNDSYTTPADSSRAITIDSSSNIYIAGNFRNSSGGTNAFIAKYNSSGTIQWQRTLADGNTAATQSTQGRSITTDGTYVYIGGSFKNSGGGIDGYLAKYDSSGTIQWQRSFLDSLSSSANRRFVIFSLNLDSTGTIYLGGYFSNSATGANSFLGKLPNDGSKTGTYAIDATHSINYATASLTDAAGSLTEAAGATTDSAGTLTDAAGVLNDAAGSLTSVSLGI